jgi:hypothetical protein
MICSKDELLPVLQLWKADAQHVVVEVTFIDKPQLSTASVMRLIGFIKSVDAETGFFVTSDLAKFPHGDFAFFGFDDWEFSLEDRLEDPTMRYGLIGVKKTINQAIILTRPFRLKVRISA